MLYWDMDNHYSERTQHVGKNGVFLLGKSDKGYV